MKECFCLLLFMLHFTEGCYILDRQFKEVTGYTSGSVLLPCSCDDHQSTTEWFTWRYFNHTRKQWIEVFQDKKYKDRLKLFNQTSPANLSLIISDLCKEDEGDYECKTPQSSKVLRVTIKGDTICTRREPVNQTEKPTTNSLFIVPSVFAVLLLVAVLALIFWKCRESNVQKMTTSDKLVLVKSENEKQNDLAGSTQVQNVKQNENEDEVTYTSVVHVKSPAKPTQIQTVVTEHSEYASIK